MKKMYIDNIIYFPLLMVAIFMLILPDLVISVFNIIVAILFILNGLKHVVEYYLVESNNSFINGLVLGVMNLLIGIMIIVSDMSLVNLLPIMIAIIAIFYAINNFSYLLTAKKLTDHTSISKLLRGILGLVIGTLLLQNTDAFSSVLVRLTGAGLIFVIFYINYQLYQVSKIPKVKRIKKKKS